MVLVHVTRSAKHFFFCIISHLSRVLSQSPITYAHLQNCIDFFFCLFYFRVASHSRLVTPSSRIFFFSSSFFSRSLTNDICFEHTRKLTSRDDIDRNIYIKTKNSSLFNTQWTASVYIIKVN